MEENGQPQCPEKGEHLESMTIGGIVEPSRDQQEQRLPENHKNIKNKDGPSSSDVATPSAHLLVARVA